MPQVMWQPLALLPKIFSGSPRNKGVSHSNPPDREVCRFGAVSEEWRRRGGRLLLYTVTREGTGDVYEEASNCVLKSASCWSANGGVDVGFVVGEIPERWKGARPKKDEALCRAAGQETLLIAETEGILICKG
ncbi:hypothetical protein LSTR_LSTR008775 [Laodelphax striatellus]|uniref:Uncharacterized protein n=1 Tax=Laodelphax striatellus TaxID=195883 RepID=A0A482XSR0_LAOST|nr:hypothetical protein LSTR_LSTR008775 [Laodelphax striatellus]